MTSIEGLIALLIKNALCFGANYTSNEKIRKKKKQNKTKTRHTRKIATLIIKEPAQTGDQRLVNQTFILNC